MTFHAQESAFFTVEFPDYGTAFESVAQSVESLDVTEEMDKAIQGSITMRDPDFMLSRVLRANARMLLSWGYKRNNVPASGLFDAKTADVISRPMERRGLSVYVLNPRGSADDRGNHTFSCGFMSSGWFGNKLNKVWESGTKATVVTQVLQKLGAEAWFVNFDRMNEAYSSESVERQCETDFQFLCRLAKEWRCVFRLGFLPSGGTAGMFCDPNKLGTSPIVQLITGSKSNRLELNWRDGPSPNVLSYAWQNQEGENGAGDNARVIYVNGQPVFQRFTVKDDVVTTWQINMDAIRDKLASSGGSEAELVSMAMRADSLEDPRISWAFTKVDQRTAPNGYGYSVTGEMLGEPMMTAGTMATFLAGFPDCLKRRADSNSPVDFWVRKVSHSISSQGYRCGFEAVDTYTQMGLLSG